MSGKEYYQRHRERIKARVRAYKAAHPERSAARYALYRAIVTALKQRGCVDCGERDLTVLEFDHVRGRKRCEIAVMRLRPLADLFIELAKCEVRCANCHKRATVLRRHVA